MPSTGAVVINNWYSHALKYPFSTTLSTLHMEKVSGLMNGKKCLIGFLWHFPDYQGGYFYLFLHPFLYLIFSSRNTGYFHNIERRFLLFLTVLLKQTQARWWGLCALIGPSSVKGQVIPKPAIIRRQENLALWGSDWDPPEWLADGSGQGTGSVPQSWEQDYDIELQWHPLCQPESECHELPQNVPFSLPPPLTPQIQILELKAKCYAQKCSVSHIDNINKLKWTKCSVLKRWLTQMCPFLWHIVSLKWCSEKWKIRELHIIRYNNSKWKNRLYLYI